MKEKSLPLRTCAVALTASQIVKYPERFATFIDHIKAQRPFYVLETDQAVVLDPAEAERYVQLHADKQFKGRVTGRDIEGNEWLLGQFQKTTEFGGATNVPGVDSSASQFATKESAALKPSYIGITDCEIRADRLADTIINNPVLQQTEYGRAVVAMAQQLVDNRPVTIPEDIAKHTAIKRAIVDYAGEYLGVLALVLQRSEWFGGSDRFNEFKDWLGTDLSKLTIVFPSNPITPLADSYASVRNSVTGKTINISSKGTGGGAAPSVRGIRVPDGLRKKKKYRTAIEIIDICHSEELPAPRSVSQVFAMMNLLHKHTPELIPAEFTPHLPWDDRVHTRVVDSLNNGTALPEYATAHASITSKGTDGGKLTYAVKKAVIDIVNSGAIPKFSELVLNSLDFNFIQQYAIVDNKTRQLQFKTQWPGRTYGQVTLETKSGGSNPMKGGFSFRLKPLAHE